MSCFMVFGAGAALVIAGCMASAQTPVTNLFINLNKATYSPIFGSGWLTSSGAPDERNIDPGFVAGMDASTSLLGSFNSTNPNEDWTLFLSDLDFGAQGTLAQWGPIVTAIPEPSSWTLLALGGAAVATSLVHRRHAFS